MRETKIFKFDGKDYEVPRYLNNERYRVEGIFAKGGMGLLYKAIDTKMQNKQVLIKTLLYKPILFKRKNDIARKNQIEIVREQAINEKVALKAGMAKNLGSIPTFLDYFEDFNPLLFGPHKDVLSGEEFTVDQGQNEPYIVINYFSGQPIDKIKHKDNNSRLGFTKAVFRTIAKLLKGFHERYNGELELIYCDLKPANILNTKEKAIVLIDMGSFAIKVNGTLENSLLTTPGYCAPEINSDVNPTPFEADVCPRVDVYSLGATLYELITEQKPLFQNGENVFDFDKVQHVAPKWIGFLQKALENIPEDRFQTMDEMLDGYYQMVEGQTNSFTPSNFVPKRPAKDKSLPQLPLPDGWKFYRFMYQSSNYYSVYEVEKTDGSFQLQAFCVLIDTEKVERNYEKDDIGKRIFLSYLKNNLQTSLRILTKNLYYLPEPISYIDGQTNDIPLIIYYKPSGGKFVRKQGAIQEQWIAERMSKILKMFKDAFFKKIILRSINGHTVQFDSSGQVSINDFFSLLDDNSMDQILNNLSQKILHKSHTAPEIVQNGNPSDKTYSYLAGKLMLEYVLGEKGFLNHFQNKPFPSKIDLESLVNPLPISSSLKKFILTSMPVEPTDRASLDDLILQLKNVNLGSKPINVNLQTKNYQKPKSNRAVLVSFVNKLTYKNYVDKIKFINEVNQLGTEIYWFKRINIFSYKPNPKYLESLKKKKEDYVTTDKNQATNELINVLQQRQEKVLLLLADDSIQNSVIPIQTELEKYDKVYYYGVINPFGNLGNMEYKNINSYLEPKGKK